MDGWTEIIYARQRMFPQAATTLRARLVGHASDLEFFCVAPSHCVEISGNLRNRFAQRCHSKQQGRKVFQHSRFPFSACERIYLRCA